MSEAVLTQVVIEKVRANRPGSPPGEPTDLIPIPVINSDVTKVQSHLNKLTIRGVASKSPKYPAAIVINGQFTKHDIDGLLGDINSSEEESHTGVGYALS